ncbi:hypothetical protein PSPO01_15246 [Paraphaeosphaeria sporulosa]
MCNYHVCGCASHADVSPPETLVDVQSPNRYETPYESLPQTPRCSEEPQESSGAQHLDPALPQTPAPSLAPAPRFYAPKPTIGGQRRPGVLDSRAGVFVYPPRSPATPRAMDVNHSSFTIPAKPLLSQYAPPHQRMFSHRSETVFRKASQLAKLTEAEVRTFTMELGQTTVMDQPDQSVDGTNGPLRGSAFLGVIVVATMIVLSVCGLLAWKIFKRIRLIYEKKSGRGAALSSTNEVVDKEIMVRVLKHQDFVSQIC